MSGSLSMSKTMSSAYIRILTNMLLSKLGSSMFVFNLKPTPVCLISLAKSLINVAKRVAEIQSPCLTPIGTGFSQDNSEAGD